MSTPFVYLWKERELYWLKALNTVLCKSNANVFPRNSKLFLAFRRKIIELLMEANFRRKVTIIRDAYCFQLHEFPNDNSCGTKIDFEFSSENSLCSINDFEHLREISFFISLCLNIPEHFLHDNLPSSNLLRWFFLLSFHLFAHPYNA